MYGRIASGASVWPTKMSETVEKLSAPDVPRTRASAAPHPSHDERHDPDVVEQRHQRREEDDRRQHREREHEAPRLPVDGQLAEDEARAASLKSSRPLTASLAHAEALPHGSLEHDHREHEQDQEAAAHRAQVDGAAPRGRAEGPGTPKKFSVSYTDVIIHARNLAVLIGITFMQKLSEPLAECIVRIFMPGLDTIL